MRWLGILVRIVGWLLAPLVVWAASFCAAWLVLQAARHFENPKNAIIAALVGALVVGIAVLLLWMRLLRRSPRLRHSLQIDPEGLPVLEALVADPSAEPVPAASGKDERS